MRRLSPDVVMLACIVFMAAISPAFMGDDAAFWNYLHNTSEPSLFYYYGGYVQFLPQSVSFLLRPLPPFLQAVLYRAVPLLLVALLYREVARVLSRDGASGDWRAVSFALVLILCSFETLLLANVSHAHWTALALAIAVVVRYLHTGAPYRPAAAAAILLGGCAFPLGVVIAAQLTWSAVAGAVERRVSNASLAAVIVLVQALVALHQREPMMNTEVLSAPVMFIDAFRHQKFANLVTLGAMGVLGVIAAWLWMRRTLPGPRAEWRVLASLCLAGWGSVGAIVVSRQFGGGMEIRYAVPVLFCALVAVAWTVVRCGGRSAYVGAGVIAGVAAALTATTLYTSLRGPLELSLMKYQFIRFATAECAAAPRSDAVFVFDDDSSSPVVWCQPPAPPPHGDVLHMRDFVPAIGAADPEVSADRKPFLLYPRSFP